MFSIDNKKSLFRIALAALIILVGCEPEGDPRLSTDDRDALRPLGESAFDSSEHPDLSELSDVVAGFFLPDNRLALVERSEIHMIDISSGEAQVVGREGEGPREFRHIWPAKRTPGGILVSDALRRRVSLITHDGEFLHSQSVLAAEFQDFFNAYPVGIHPDGRIVFRDGVNRMTRQYNGRTWHPATYVTVHDDGELQILAQAKGNEVYYGSKRSGSVVFGHRTLEAATEDHLIIAETSRGAIAVLDWSGEEVAEIPMSAGLPLTADLVQVGREARMAELKRIVEGMKSRAAASGQELAMDLDVFYESPELEDWPANEVAPPIDTLLTDFDTRLWTRDYRLPDQDSATWRVWDIDRQELLFTARMAGDDILLDARGDFVLLHRVDDLDVPRALVTQLRAPPGNS